MKRIVLAIAALLFASPVMATTIDFTTLNPSPLNSFGNSIVITVDGIEATLRGYSAGSLSEDFTASQLKRWPTGIGSCNSDEGLNCPGGPHTVDNDGRDDMLLITFSESVLAGQAEIAAWAQDFDVTYWGGTGTPDWLSIGFEDLGTGFTDPFNLNNAPANGSLTRPVVFSSLLDPVDWIVFAPSPGSYNPDNKTDKFKFKTVSFTVPEEDTPEPGTLALLWIGAALLAARRRKQS